MKTLIFCVTISILSMLAPQPRAQDKPVAAVPLNDAEQKFKDLLTDCTMEGRWYSVKDGEMGEEKHDKYNIVSISKIKGDSWVINTKMKYGQREMTLPLTIEVKWA